MHFKCNAIFNLFFPQGQSTEQPTTPTDAFPGPSPDSSMSMDPKVLYGAGYPGPPSMGMQGGYGPGPGPNPGPNPGPGPGPGPGPIQGHPAPGFNPMMQQMGGMMGINPRASMMRPRMINAKQPLRLHLQQRLQGQQVRIRDIVHLFLNYFNTRHLSCNNHNCL